MNSSVQADHDQKSHTVKRRPFSSEYPARKPRDKLTGRPLKIAAIPYSEPRKALQKKSSNNTTDTQIQNLPTKVTFSASIDLSSPSPSPPPLPKSPPPIAPLPPRPTISYSPAMPTALFPRSDSTTNTTIDMQAVINYEIQLLTEQQAHADALEEVYKKAEEAYKKAQQECQTRQHLISLLQQFHPASK